MAPNVDNLTEPLTENQRVEINKYKFNHCSIPSDHVMLQTNNANLLLRLWMTLERFSFNYRNFYSDAFENIIV